VDSAATTESNFKVQLYLQYLYLTFLDIVVSKRAPIFQLLAGEDESLLIGRDTFLILNLALNHVNGIRGFDLAQTKSNLARYI
jgi:hypothetical protein